MSEIRPPYGTQQEPALLTDTDLVDIKTRLYGGDAEGIPAHLAELLFTDLPRLLTEVERVRWLLERIPLMVEEGEVIGDYAFDSELGDEYFVADGRRTLEEAARRIRQVRGGSE